MANPFEIAPASPLQALMMGQQGYNQGRKYVQENALSQAGQLYAAGDIKGAQAAAAQGGSLQALMGFAGLQNSDRDFAFRQEEAKRAQGNTDISQDLQERQINASTGQSAAQLALAKAQFEHQKEVANRAEIRSIKDDNGNDVLVRIDRQGVPQRLNVPGGGGEQNNPFLTGGAMNESQSKDALYANRMLNAERTFRDPRVIEAGMSVAQRGMGAIPGAGNFMVSDQYQKYDQAQRDFINATLRRESGAVISPSEFDNAAKQYFPRPGDSQEVLKQKQQNRIEAIKGIGAGGGKGYKPNASFDPQGNIVERGAPAQAAAPVQISSPQQRDSLPPGTQYIAPDGSIRTKQ